jgi:hypothetical protein
MTCLFHHHRQHGCYIVLKSYTVRSSVGEKPEVSVEQRRSTPRFSPAAEFDR